MSEPKFTDEDLKRVAGIKDEIFDGQLAAIMENIDAVLDKRLVPIERDLSELKSDMKVVKAAVTSTNREVRELDKRVARLEAAA